MDPVTAALNAAQKGFEFGIELLKFWQTEQGQKHFAMLMEDRARWDKFWSDTTTGIQKVFGDIGKANNK